ncbi:MAG: flagellar basal body P-ring protein FlgI [Planctomycetota bacterium]|nr:MAG: flagellar basal body P-ring protein FlgI [Planctomycetota bacterium]
MPSIRIAILAGVLLAAGPTHAARVKDIADVVGVRENQLMGLGLVVGLNGSGDSAPFLAQALSNALQRLGMRVDPAAARAKNAALVYVTATLPPFVRAGSRIDVTVSSVGDAKSLLGGTLLRAALEGPDGKVYAVAQGPLTVGGFQFSGDAASAQRNHPTVGRIPGGALVEREVPARLLGPGNQITLTLHERSFAVSEALARAISEKLPVAAVAEDGGTVRVVVPESMRHDGALVSLIARLGELEIEQDVEARVVINERTGTIVAGEHVRISRVAISHGNLTITVSESPEVSQPAPFSPRGQTKVVPRTEVEVREARGPLRILPASVTVADLAEAMNALGVAPRDLVAIFQALKAAGALQARIVVI